MLCTEIASDTQNNYCFAKRRASDKDFVPVLTDNFVKEIEVG
jgi:hypothetical protein